MDYFWSSKNLREDVKELERLYKIETNPRIKEQLLYYIAETKSLILEEESPSKEDKDDYFEIMTNLVPLFESYYPYFEEYRQILDKYVESISINNISKKRLLLKKDELLDLTHAFYKSIGGDVYKCFEKIFEDRYNNIRFKKHNNGFAATTTVPGLNKSYFTIEEPNSKNYRSVLLSLIHELGHGISAQISPDRYERDDSFLTEIETTFFEFIANDFFSKELNDKEFYEDEADRLLGGYSTAEDILLTKKIIDIRYELGNPPKQKFLKLLKDEESRTLINNPEGLGIEDDVKYLFAYIIAIELYEIYKKDKKEALNLLNLILLRKSNETELQNTTKLVIPNKSLIKFKNHIIKNRS